MKYISPLAIEAAEHDRKVEIVEAFDKVADLVAAGQRITGVEVAGFCDGMVKPYVQLEAWILSRGYETKIENGKIYYQKKA
jgi:hypothetical protein